ncbi:LuxR C-terminal-related transcriptional regulator [Fusibacter sp. 3D3]|uniref:LuxR C-terminal-related transcriptional regulator n=1 Tax=Fusibacter sp. 3D3 TaxID=1048380 RepID=UPI0008535E0E|nr:LuxR C-terminal-related transcriptional regulator [Fusibacter sp. 3D3]GAU78557.1 transcriptionalactivator of maltose regulon MalT [Fusibacter sp. 3D3]
MNITRYLKRERINRLLSSLYNYPLTIVEAPMGFGKTTAVKRFLETEKCNTLWLSIPSSNESTSSIWNKFATELTSIDKGAAEKLKELGYPIDFPQVDKVLSVLNDIVFKKKTVFVIDDLHLMQDLSLNTLLLQIVAENIEHLHMLLITRDTTHIDFTELLSKGMCYIISQQRLRFTDSEVRDYCHLLYGALSESDLEKINHYTDGWISLIYLILLGLESNIPVGMNSSINDLVEKVLFNPYDESIQLFLLKLSIMDEFTMKQAGFVTHEEKTSDLLKKLHKENAFVYYDDIHKIYKIHNVLLDFLRLKQNFSVKENNELYSRLGEWYLQKKQFATAYRYLNRAGAFEQILSHLNKPENIRNELTHFEGSLELFTSVSKDLLYKYPLAYLQHILYSVVNGVIPIQNCDHDLDQLITVYDQLEDIDLNYKNRIIAEAMIIKKFTTFNNINLSSNMNDEIIRRLNGRQSYIMLRENESTFGSPHLLYIYFKTPGTFKDIMHTVSEKYVAYASFANGCGTGSDYLALAEYALETGNLETAELNSFKSIYKARTKEQICILICANFTLVRLYILQGKISEALEMFTQFEEEVSELNNPIYNTTLDMCKGYIYACLDHAEKIPYWLQKGEMTKADFFYQGIAFNYIIYGKAVLLTKNYVQLNMLTEYFQEHFAIFNNQLGFIHNSIFETVSKYKLYGQKEGIIALKKALSLGQTDHIVMPFVENALHLIEILKIIALQNLDNNYIQKVLALSEKYLESLKNDQIIQYKLTRREIEVLKLSAEGLNREAIANHLFISQGTVKTHFRNIYQKLEVNGKVSAIKAAQIQGII